MKQSTLFSYSCPLAVVDATDVDGLLRGEDENAYTKAHRCKDKEIWLESSDQSLSRYEISHTSISPPPP